VIDKDLTIQGPGANQLTVRNADTANITNSTFKDNYAAIGGGGIYSRGTTTVTNSTFSNNQAGNVNGLDCGGGIYVQTGTFSLTNSTVSNNQCFARDTLNGGGGIDAEGGTLSITNSTITKNVAGIFTGNGTQPFPTRGGGIYNPGGATVNVRNSIIAGNNPGFAVATDGLDYFGALNSQGHNIIGITDAATITGDTTGNIVGTSAAPVDARLVPLAYNGGGRRRRTLCLPTRPPSTPATRRPHPRQISAARPESARRTSAPSR
jgi:hypothetical protein